jgi:hypothetical protein
MSVYRPTYAEIITDKQTGARKKTGKRIASRIWWYEFVFGGRRVIESSKSTRKTVALEAEKNRRKELEEAFAGISPNGKPSAQRIRTVNAAIDAYVKGYGVNHAPKTTTTVEERAPHVKRLLGSLLISDITTERLLAYMETRCQN